MVKYPGVLAVLVASSLSPNQVCTANTTDAQPMYLFRVKMAAMGSVEDSVAERSPLSPLEAGS